jgi:hypothetical protein
MQTVAASSLYESNSRYGAASIASIKSQSAVPSDYAIGTYAFNYGQRQASTQSTYARNMDMLA